LTHILQILKYNLDIGIKVGKIEKKK